MRRLIATMAVAVALAGCQASSSGDSSGGVDWENYSPTVKVRIDSLAAAGDCSGLQSEFDIADANDDAQRDRVGSGNADLMSYIDDKLRSAGCY